MTECCYGSLLLFFRSHMIASRLDPEEKNVIRSVIESIVLRNTFKTAERRFTNTDSGVTPR